MTRTVIDIDDEKLSGEASPGATTVETVNASRRGARHAAFSTTSSGRPPISSALAVRSPVGCRTD